MPSGTMEYVDSPALKALCLSRCLSTDPAERATLTRHNMSFRHVEKTSWFQSLHQRSREGDAHQIPKATLLAHTKATSIPSSRPLVASPEQLMP